MLIQLLGLGFAAMVASVAPDSVMEFDAALAPAPNVSTSLASANGFAAVTVEGSTLQFDVALVDLKHVIEVAVIDRGRAVPLYSGTDTRGTQVRLEGTLRGEQITDVPLDELVQDMRAGTTQMVIFTLGEPGGALSGALIPGPTTASKAPIS